MKLYAVQVAFNGDYGYTSEEVRWELCTKNRQGEWELYTRHPGRYYNGHTVLPETAIFVTNIGDNNN